MKAFLAEHPDAGVAVDQLKYTKPWYATFNYLAVAQPMGDAIQAVVSGKMTAAEAASWAQSQADQILAPFVRSTAYTAD